MWPHVALYTQKRMPVSLNFIRAAFFTAFVCCYLASVRLQCDSDVFISNAYCLSILMLSLLPDLKYFAIWSTTFPVFSKFEIKVLFSRGRTEVISKTGDHTFLAPLHVLVSWPCFKILCGEYFNLCIRCVWIPLQVVGVIHQLKVKLFVDVFSSTQLPLDIWISEINVIDAATGVVSARSFLVFADPFSQIVEDAVLRPYQRWFSLSFSQCWLQMPLSVRPS